MDELGKLEQELNRARTARPPHLEKAAEIIETMVAHPDAADVLYLPELLEELADSYANMGRFDEAISTMKRALAAGWEGTPDGRHRIAEFLLRAGRADEAHTLYAIMKADTPEDVWLYNAAGLEYQAVDDHARALQWLSEGLELALQTGDPERLVDQFSKLRGETLAALGREADELQARAGMFLANTAKSRFNRKPLPTVRELPAEKAAIPGVRFAVAWFPAAEFTAAVTRWPELREGLEVSTYEEYTRELQAQMLRFGAQGMKPDLAPIQVEPYVRWCESEALDAGSSATRSRYAAVLARRGETLAWPPGRNDPCWCGSGRKYKKCCGTVGLKPLEE